MLGSSDNLMRDDLRTNNLIPTTSPYVDAITCSLDVFSNAVSSNNNIVDWVFVELREDGEPTVVVDSQSALLQRDGDVVAIDGVSKLIFDQPYGNYYMVIKHRNHLGVMTANAISIADIAVVIDFTNANNQITFGTNAQTDFGMPTDVVAMWSGDVNTDGVIQYSGGAPDAPSILSQVVNDSGNFLGFPTYTISAYDNNDINMNGNIQYSGSTPDTPFILQNVLSHPNNFLNFGTYSIQEQLPQN
jgi:hypothetical protein